MKKNRIEDCMLSCPLCEAKSTPLPFEEGKYAECESCALRFLRSEFHLKEADEKDRYLLHEHPSNDPGYEKYLFPLFDILTKTLPSGAKGLDYGSGPSPSVLGKMLMQAGYKITSYDPYFAPSKLCLNATYDFVVAAEVVEHFYQPKRDFEVLKRLVRPHGFLGVMTQLYDGVDFKNWYYRRDPVHVSFYAEKTFRWIAKELLWTGIEIVKPKTILIKN